MSKKSLSFRLLLFVLKLKGLKKTFSQNPIDYNKLRKEDVKTPKGSFYKKASVFKVEKSKVTVVGASKKSDKLVLYIHGGAFVSGPGQHHWDAIKVIHKHIDSSVWMCDYPKAPEHQIGEISNNIDAIYKKALESYSSENIIIIGDSVGGTLGLALIQRLVKKGTNLPEKLILITPVLDASMSNSKIKEVDLLDPMLSLNGVLSAKKMCAENGDLSAENISPIHGNFTGFPKTILFLAEYDIMCPDQELLVDKLKASEINYEVVFGSEMPHIWPILPFFKEGKIALQQLISKM